MAITGKTNGSRLDFASEINEGIQKPEIIVPNIKKEAPARPAVTTREVQPRPAAAKPAAPAAATTSYDALFAKKGRGAQKTVYFDNDNYEYINNIAERTGCKFSVVVNTLLRSAIEKVK